MPRRHVALAARPVGEPYVDADDIDDVVAAVLTEDGRAGPQPRGDRGPRQLSFAGAVEDLAEATGRTIRYVRVSTERYAALLAEQDVPEEVVVRLRRVIDKLVDGRNAAADPGVERAIGREPRDFADHAHPAASTRKPATTTALGRATDVQRLGEDPHRTSKKRSAPPLSGVTIVHRHDERTKLDAGAIAMRGGCCAKGASEDLLG